MNSKDQQLAHFDEVLRQRTAVRLAFADWQHHKDIASAKKKKYEAEQSALDVLLDEDPLQQKLFKPEAAATVADDWRSLDINQLQNHGVTESQCDKLSAAGIDTLGDLQDWMQKHGQFWTRDIKGIGESKAEAIADAMNAIVMADDLIEDYEYVDESDEA